MRNSLGSMGRDEDGGADLAPQGQSETKIGTEMTGLVQCGSSSCSLGKEIDTDKKIGTEATY